MPSSSLVQLSFFMVIMTDYGLQFERYTRKTHTQGLHTIGSGMFVLSYNMYILRIVITHMISKFWYFLPTFTNKNQPNVGSKYTSPMDPLGLPVRCLRGMDGVPAILADMKKASAAAKTAGF